tara:strand:- start:437 stop:616 length:180 start_codon:yes stop_codon:yes gene_type:complete
MKKKEKLRLNKQLKILNKATDIALKQVEEERFGKKKINYIEEWFRYIELTAKQLHKHVN